MISRNISTSAVLVLALLLVMIPLTTSAPLATDTTSRKTQGICSLGFEWSEVMPLSSFGATCCPTGYKAESAKVHGGSGPETVFCCPAKDKAVPCEARYRQLPKIPLTCPKPGKLVGAQCEGY